MRFVQTIEAHFEFQYAGVAMLSCRTIWLCYCELFLKEMNKRNISTAEATLVPSIFNSNILAIFVTYSKYQAAPLELYVLEKCAQLCIE